MADDVTFNVADEPAVPLSVTDPSSESADFAIGDAIIEAVSPTVDMGKVYMMITVAIVPIIIAYLFLSKFIIAGVALGSVKG